MRTTLFRSASSLVIILALVCSSLSASADTADTPYLRALLRGRRHEHRPNYKQYKARTHKSHRGLALFKK